MTAPKTLSLQSHIQLLQLVSHLRSRIELLSAFGAIDGEKYYSLLDAMEKELTLPNGATPSHQ